MVEQRQSHGLAQHNSIAGAPCRLAAVDPIRAELVAAISHLTAAGRKQWPGNARLEQTCLVLAKDHGRAGWGHKLQRDVQQGAGGWAIRDADGTHFIQQYPPAGSYPSAFVLKPDGQGTTPHQQIRRLNAATAARSAVECDVVNTTVTDP